MGRLAVIDSGAYWMERALYRAPFAELIDDTLYLPDLTDDAFDPERFDALVFGCRTPPELVVPHAAAIRAFLDAGRMVVAMGESGAHVWLPGVQWVSTPTNFWWWLDAGPESGVRPTAPEHGLWRHLAPDDVIWHYHGIFTPPTGAISVIDHMDGGSLFYDDRVTTPGRSIVTSLDPFFHYGNHFMPATERFLTGFLPWLRAEVDGQMTHQP